MFIIKGTALKKNEIDSYMKELEVRTTSFMRKFIITVADNFAKQIKGRYKNINEEEAQLIRDNIEAFFVKTKVVPKKDFGDKRKLTKEIERHYSAVMVHAVKRTAKEHDVNTTVIKVLANKKSLKQSPPEIFMLVRYGPWTIETLPFVPKDEDGTILFIKSTVDQVKKVKDKNEKQDSFVRNGLLKFNVKLTSKEQNLELLEGYDSLEFWTVKKEFGIDARKQSVWKPAIDYMYKDGYKKIIALDPNVFRILFDPNFKHYKKPESGYKIINEQHIQDTHDFQERLG